MLSRGSSKAARHIKNFHSVGSSRNTWTALLAHGGMCNLCAAHLAFLLPLMARKAFLMKWLINGISRDPVSRVYLLVRTRACVCALVTAVSNFMSALHCCLRAAGGRRQQSSCVNAATISVSFDPYR